MVPDQSHSKPKREQDWLSREVELGSRSRMVRQSCRCRVVPQQLLDLSVFVTLFRTAIESVISGAHRLLRTGGVPTLTDIVLAVADGLLVVFTGRSASASYQSSVPPPPPTLPVPNKPYGFCGRKAPRLLPYANTLRHNGTQLGTKASHVQYRHGHSAQVNHDGHSQSVVSAVVWAGPWIGTSPTIHCTRTGRCQRNPSTTNKTTTWLEKQIIKKWRTLKSRSSDRCSLLEVQLFVKPQSKVQP